MDGKPLVQGELNELVCAVPGCTSCETGMVFFRSKCHHEHKGVDTCYHKDTGTIEVTCAVCNQHVASIQVARQHLESVCL